MSEIETEVDWPTGEGEDVIEITTSRPVGTRIPFRIAGEIYRFRVPKMHGLLEAVKGMQDVDRDDVKQSVEMYHEIESWMFRCLETADAERLKARLADEADEVDVDHIVQVFQRLVGKAAKRPPTSGSV